MSVTQRCAKDKVGAEDQHSDVRPRTAAVLQRGIPHALLVPLTTWHQTLPTQAIVYEMAHIETQPPNSVTTAR
jgi:hypothetical protein